MFQVPTNELHVRPEYQPLFRELALDAEAVFTHPQIRIWRKLADRENGTLDADLNGRRVRLHVKRYPAARKHSPAEQEIAGHRLLAEAGIPTAALAAWGRTIDRKSFVMFEDLTGYEPADKLIAHGTPFERLLVPVADLAARLHHANLHHRDLYLCHFFARIEGDKVDVRLIDVARVARMRSFLTRRRWIVKDLAQFWYSTLALPINDAQRQTWLEQYGRQRRLRNTAALRRKIVRKSTWIARHDARLRQQQPNRNVSIPS